MEYVLQANSLNKNYFGFHAINDLNINVPKGSIYGLVGKNGAGKTTLIRLICGLQQPTSGEFSIYGAKYNEKAVNKSRSRMGAVVESPSIYLNMTAEDNLKMQYRMLGMPSFDDIPKLLELVGLADTGRKKAKNFSLGMRQRLGIAIALAGNPDFLILDEPINGLDPQGIIEIRELILKLNREKDITILISSHILEELAKLATHYGFMDKGSILKEISSEDLENACRKSIQAEVSDINALSLILDRMNIEYSIIDENKADIFEKLNITQLVHELDKENCELISVAEHDESLESYYINLVGGEKNA